jgi:phosphorylase kinase alpha/beta subunit
MHRLLDIFLKHEYKIDWAIKEKPKHAYQYIHARYHPETLNEFWTEWGNKQNDAIGLFLFRLAEMLTKNYSVLRTESDKRIVQKLIFYLQSLEYWQDSDHGVWEGYEEIHASSIGACLAGLKAISSFFIVPNRLIVEGEKALNALLPRESQSRETDLALLSLIYPYNVVNDEMKAKILADVEQKLVRNKGVIRFSGDWYYNKNGDAEWTMGFPWLAIIYKQLGNKEKYQFYMNKTLSCFNDKGELPELYYANSSQHNENSPLGWAQALYIVAAL